MKIIYLLITILLFVITSCTTNINNANEIAADEIIERTIESKYYKITYNSVIFKKNEEPISIINDSINRFIKLEIKTFINSIDDDIKELIDSNDISGKYELNIITNHYITTYGYISTIIELNHYTLGAHGSSVFKSINFDIINNKFVNLHELSDITNKNKLEKFNNLLNKYFVNKDSCFSVRPKIDKDFNIFTIQEDSIAIYFASYELGAYACGSAKIMIPIKELP